MSIKLKKTLYLSCAALMLLGTGMTSANAFVGQNNQVHASRRYRRRIRRYHRVKGTYYPKGSYKGLPWKKAWNKYLKSDAETIWTFNKYYTAMGANGSTKTAKSELKAWANYRKAHNNKRALTNSQIGFGTYSNLAAANSNMNTERHMSTKRVIGVGNGGLDFPASYTHVGGLRTRRETNLRHAWHPKDETRTGMLEGNWPLRGFTPHMLRSLHSVAIAAHNGQTLHHSFFVWYRGAHHQPTLKFGGRPYTYNGKEFVVDRGTNGYGVVYQYNPRTRHYKRVSAKRTSKKLKNVLGAVQQATQRQQQHVAESQSQAAVHNPALSSQTKQVIQDIINEQKALQDQLNQMKQGSQSNAQNDQNQQKNVVQAMQNTASQGQKTNNANMSTSPFVGFWDDPANAYKQLANNNQIDQAQRQRLNYMSKSIEKTQQQPQIQLSNKLQYYITILKAVGAYDGLSPEQQIEKTQYLLMHPSILNVYVQKYHLNPGIDNTKDPSAQASNANNSGNNSQMKQGSIIITNNPITANEQEQFVQELGQLAKLDNIDDNL